MSLIVNLGLMIADETSLTMDVDIFIGGQDVTLPRKCVWIKEATGSLTYESGMKERIVQVAAKDVSYVDAETLAWTVYALFDHVPGFSSARTSSDYVRNCEPLSSPTPARIAPDGSTVFTWMMRLFQGED